MTTRWIVIAGLGAVALAAVGFGVYKFFFASDSPGQDAAGGIAGLESDILEGGKDLGEETVKAAEKAGEGIAKGVKEGWQVASHVGTAIGKELKKTEAVVFKEIGKGLREGGHELNVVTGKLLGKDAEKKLISVEHTLGSGLKHGIKEGEHIEHDIEKGAKAVGHAASKVWKSFSSIF